MVLYPDPSASLLLLIYVMNFRDELVVNMFATSIIRSGYQYIYEYIRMYSNFKLHKAILKLLSSFVSIIVKLSERSFEF